MMGVPVVCANMMLLIMGLKPNGLAERRARRHLGLALYLSRVRSSEMLGGSLECHLCFSLS